MRLVNTNTLELESFLSNHKPRYAILSHTWGSGEILFEDIHEGPDKLRESKKHGLAKVLQSAETAKGDGLGYIWIDTCCIDKSSSSELQEAINSMFGWYKDAVVCYAFLSDYRHNVDNLFGDPGPDFAKSRWFTRGWTLQELIAPDDVKFYDQDWAWFGTRNELSDIISKTSGIDEVALVGPSAAQRRSIGDVLSTCSIAKKMSWAACRQTTRDEDMTYSLLGIFDIHMPLIYGEGSAAFPRLQLEISRRYAYDQSIMAWTLNHMQDFRGPFDKSYLRFAPYPLAFKYSGKYHPSAAISNTSALSTSCAGIELNVFLAWSPHLSVMNNGRRECCVAVLNCSDETDEFSCVGLLLNETTLGSKEYTRNPYDPLLSVSPSGKHRDFVGTWHTIGNILCINPCIHVCVCV